MDRGRRCCLHASPVRPGRHRYPASGSWAPRGNVAFPSPRHCDPWWRPGKLGIWMGVWLAVAKNLLQVGMCLKIKYPVKSNSWAPESHACLSNSRYFKVSLISLILQNTCIFHIISQVPWFFSQNQRWFRRPEHLKTMTNRKLLISEPIRVFPTSRADEWPWRRSWKSFMNITRRWTEDRGESFVWVKVGQFFVLKPTFKIWKWKLMQHEHL